jgi:hypothetical protein
MAETQTETANLDKVLKRVRQLIDRANAPVAEGATEEERAGAEREARQAQEMADALMLKYAIDAAQARESTPAQQRVRPVTLTVPMGRYNEMFWVSQSMANAIARHTRCLVSPKNVWDSNTHEYVMKVYGFQADVKFFEVMFTSLQLHMLGVLLPKVQTEQSLEQNCVRLHHAGYNWLQIAELYGWRKVDMAYRSGPAELLEIKVPFEHRETGQISPATTVGGIYKRAYYRGIEATGQQPVKVAAGTLESFRLSAAQGYLTELKSRLRQIETGRLAGSGLILKSSMDEVRAMYDADHPKVNLDASRALPCPKCEKAKSGHCREHPRGSYRMVSFSDAGYAAGAAHARSADLNPAAGAGRKAEIG